MNVRLTPHAAELLEAVRARRGEPVERILEHALEVLAREATEPEKTISGEAQRRAVSDLLDFIKQNRVHLGSGVSVKELIHGCLTVFGNLFILDCGHWNGRRNRLPHLAGRLPVEADCHRSSKSRKRVMHPSSMKVNAFERNCDRRFAHAPVVFGG